MIYIKRETQKKCSLYIYIFIFLCSNVVIGMKTLYFQGFRWQQNPTTGGNKIIFLLPRHNKLLKITLLALLPCVAHPLFNHFPYIYKNSKIMVRVDVKDAVDSIRREFRDLTNDEFNLGVARAINHTISKVRTASSREIRQIYNIPAKELRAAITLKRASRRMPEGLVIAQGKPFALKHFKPRQTKQGVSVLIKKGQRQLIKGAFLATMSSGHSTVFARGTYRGAQGFSFRRNRVRAAGGYKRVKGRSQPMNNDLAISGLTTVSAPLAFRNAVVLDNLAKKVNEEFPDRLMHEMKRMR